MIEKIKGLFKAIYIKLFKINDTPQKIALGVALGVFSGVMPCIGILTALFLAVIFRANRASAIIGTLLTNTWTSFLTFILSIKIGSAIMGIYWKDIYSNWLSLLKDFHFYKIFKISVLQIIFPVALGYLVVGAVFGILAYFLTILLLIYRRKNEDKSRIKLS